MIAMTPLISVIIPCYNTANYLGRCLESLLQQSMPCDKYEILLIDNGSMDHSLQIAQEYVPRIRLLTENKQGSYAARNRGLSAAEGRLIAFTDSDCAPGKDWLAEIAAVFEDSGVQAILGPRKFPATAKRVRLLEDYETEKMAYIYERGDSALYYGYTNNMAIRQDVFERLGPFHEIQRGADTLFTQQIVHEYGCDALRFDRRLWVEHLEIRSLKDYYRKQWVHARSNSHLTRVCSYRPLNQNERWTIFRRVARRYQLHSWQTIEALLLLGVGAVIYETGERTRKKD
jgi:glycosyltransferase involved in cell wall biosynthesis